MINVIIAKPTKHCNADCSYCSSPPDGERQWSSEDLEQIFRSLKGNVSGKATMIWHGGEPMLMGPAFYEEAYTLAQQHLPGIRFSLQSNLLLYKSRLWKGIFSDIFKGSCSTSYDPDESQRTIKGSTEKYTKTFFKKIDEVMSDGFVPLVIGTYSEQTAHLMHQMYEKTKSTARPFNLRMNYCSPVGREANSSLIINPETYGSTLIEIYDRWIDDVPGFVVTPLDLMLGKIIGSEGDRCPWTRKCGGSFLGIMPNGDVYNCGDFSDLSDDWKYGNIFEGTYTPSKRPVNFHKNAGVEQIIPALLSSPAAVAIKRRVVMQPPDCQSCEHFAECQGGCVRDAVLYDRGIGGKFMYCQSWKMIFSHMKRSILNGRADNMIRWLGRDPDLARAQIKRSSTAEDVLRWS